MDQETPDTTLPLLKLIEEQRHEDALRALIEADPSDVRRVFAEAPPEQLDPLFASAPAQTAAQLLLRLVPEQAADLIARLPITSAATVVGALPSDERADLLGAVAPELREQIEQNLSAAQRAEADRLLEYPPDSAGGLMETEFLAYPATAFVRDVIRDVRANQERYATLNVQYVYVIGEGGVLAGLVPVRNLLLAREDQMLSEVALKSVVRANVQTGADDLADLFVQHGYLGLPVVDDQDRLLGVVNRSDLQDRIEERTAEQYRRSQGIVGGEELRTMPVRRRATRRLQWLGVNLILCFGGAAVVALNQDTIADALVLAAFLPVISAMSGNAAMQAATVSMRELTLGTIVPSSWRSVLIKEVGLAISVGLILGAGLGAVSALWGSSWRIGLVVGGAMTSNTLLAVCIGALVPLFLSRWKADPALASGPIATTVTDITGFSITLLLARLIN